jgi:hypothetical protein
MGGGRLVINEVIVSSDEPDRIELYNPGNDLQLSTGTWYVSDDREDLLKCELPEFELPSHGHVVIWCDGNELEDDGIHANFGLSGKDRSIHLTCLVDDEPVQVDEVPVHGATGPDASMGRLPDGSASWTRLSSITPGEPNEKALRP